MTCLYLGLLVSFVFYDWNQTIQKASNVPTSHDELSLNSIFFTVLDLLHIWIFLSSKNHTFSSRYDFSLSQFLAWSLPFLYPFFWPDYLHFPNPIFSPITSIFYIFWRLGMITYLYTYPNKLLFLWKPCSYFYLPTNIF